jgi:hypothetical protein
MKLIRINYAECVMKKIGGLFLAFIFLTLLANAADAAQRTVQMTVPGCFS